jgi:hypothetical protein
VSPYRSRAWRYRPDRVRGRLLAGGAPLVAMLTYSAAVTLYLAYLGFAGGLTGILLWPAVVLHAILTALLAWASTRYRCRAEVPSHRVLDSLTGADGGDR